MKKGFHVLSFAGISAAVVLSAGVALAQQQPSLPPSTTNPSPTQAQPGSDTKTQNDKGYNPNQDTMIQQTGTMDDKGTLFRIHEANQDEIHMGKFALTRAKNKSLEDYAKQLIDDHTKADKKVTDLAKKLHITLSMTGAAEKKEKRMERADQRTMQELKSLTGMQFNRRFLEIMHDDHDKLANLLKAQRDRGNNDKQITALIDDLLPTIERHRDEAKNLLDRMPAGAS